MQVLARKAAIDLMGPLNMHRAVLNGISVRGKGRGDT